MSPAPESVAQELVSIEIDGVPLKAPKGSMIIHVADKAGIEIPRFCYHRKLPIAANCRMCLVEVEKAPKPMPACATPVTEGMKVYTRSERALNAQRGVMEFLLINHPLDCPICDQGGECELQDQAMGYGRGISRFVEKKRVVRDKNIGPLIATEMTRCIHCTRCIRTLEIVAGQKELGGMGRGENTEIGTYIERNIDSEMSGNVIDVCPVGALTSKPFRFSARAWELHQRDSIAPHDCIGSSIHVHTYQGRVMRVAPREHEAVNEVWLSDRDRFSYIGLNSEDRLNAPMIRVDGVWEETDWNTALETLVERFSEVLINDGPEQVGALVSPIATVEEMYLLQKILRAMNCFNIDHRLRHSDFTAQDLAPLFPWLGQSIAELEDLDAVLLVGSNVRKEQPIAAHRLLKASRKGARIMAVNPVDHDFVFPLEDKLIADPVGMCTALAGIAGALHEMTGVGLPQGVSGFIADTEITGTHRAMAQRLKEGDNSTVLLGMHAIISPYFSLLQSLGSAIATMSGARLGYLAEAGNSAGAWLAGAIPHRGPAGKAIDRPGLHAHAMFERPLKAYLLLGVEPDYDCVYSDAAIAALKAAEFVVGFVSFRNRVLEECAEILLPVAPFTETEGSFVNAEGRWQSFQDAVPPYGESRPAWKVLRVLGTLLELDGFEYEDVGQVKDELYDDLRDRVPDNTLVPPDTLVTPEAVTGIQCITDIPAYALDPVVRRAAALQETADATRPHVAVNHDLAARERLEGVSRVLVRQTGGKGEWVSLPLVVDDRIPNECALIPAAVPGTEGLGTAFGYVELQPD